MSSLITRITWLMFCLSSLVVFAVSALADEVPHVSNIGFMENPSKELREKFPMCDAFLKVKWIDKEKKIGYSNYEAIIKTKEGNFKEKKIVWALVDLDVPGIDYDVYQYKMQGRLEEVFDMVRNGKVRVGIPMMIDYEGKRILLYSGATVNYGGTRPVLGDNRQTICVAYPDEQQAWIVEGKNVKQSYTAKQVAELAEKIKLETGKPIPRERIESLWLLDINFDGKEDFIFEGTFLFSKQDHMYLWESKFQYPYFIFSFPSSSRDCRTKGLLRYELTTDGKNYFYFNQCNLSELTTLSEKE